MTFEMPTHIQFEIDYGRNDPEPKYVTGVFLDLMQMIAKAGAETDDWSPIDEMLDAIPVDKVSIILLLTLARGTSQVKSKLKRWETFVKRVHEELLIRDENADFMLRGLL